MTDAVRIGETHEVLIHSKGNKGDGVTKIHGMVVFVPGSKVDNTYTVKITKVLNKFAFAEIKGED